MTPSEPEALGSWPKAPLAYVVAEFTFPPLTAAFDQLHGQFNDRIVADYPHATSGKMQEIVIEGPQLRVHEHTIHQWVDIQRRFGVVLTPQHLALHTSGYESYGRFVERLQQVLERYLPVAGSRPALQSAIRYFDIVVPEGDFATPDAFVEPALRLPRLPEGTQVGEHASSLQVVRGPVVGSTRFYSHVINPAFIAPPDFSPLPLEASRVAQTSVQHRKDGGAVGFLDVAAQAMEPAEPAAQALEARLLEARTLAKALFESATLPEARRHWGEPAGSDQTVTTAGEISTA